MSTATEITRITTARNTIRNKLIALGLAASTDKIDALATAVDGITNQGAVTATVQEGQSYTVPAGYHNGSGTVTGVSGGGNYTLQSKGPITPTKSSQSITPDQGYYGLSGVSIGAIPEAYQDVSSVTAAAGDVLATKVFVDDEGTIITGTMPNNGAVSQMLDVRSGHTSYTVPAGYHNGSGTVSLVTETKTATPSGSTQNITPTNGKVLSKVTVNPIPSEYVDGTLFNAEASDVRSGVVAGFLDQLGEPVAGHGTMPEYSADAGTAIAELLDTSNTSYNIPQGYHDGNGGVYIQPETATVTPSGSSQTVSPTAGCVLSQVTVNAIPAKYGDTTGDDAVAANLLSGKKAHSINNGAAVQITGSMPNNGAVSKTLDATSNNQSYTVPAGYHNGSGTVGIVLEEKSATPSGSSQNITPTSGKVLSKVTVAAIPAKYGDTTGDDAVAANILSGKKAHSISNGAAIQVTGTMTNNGAVAATIDGLTTTSYTVPAGYHNGSGTVSLTSDIETALAAI